MLKDRKGFTLIEFIIVMAIIGILVLMAAPKFMDYINKAKITQIQSDMRTIQSVVMADQADAIANDENAKFVTTTPAEKGKYLPVSLKNEEEVEVDADAADLRKLSITNTDEGLLDIRKNVNTKLDLVDTKKDEDKKGYVLAASENGEIYILKDDNLTKLMEKAGLEDNTEDGK